MCLQDILTIFRRFLHALHSFSELAHFDTPRIFVLTLEKPHLLVTINLRMVICRANRGF